MVNESQNTISPIERELIDYFVNAAQSFGLPKSYGEIYGLYFASETPLALDDVIERLKLSKGSASQGIRFLKSINALNSVYLPGDRRDHYTAETSLRKIADGFIKERIRPQLGNSTERLKALKESQRSSHLKKQLRTLESWSKKGELILPFVTKFLGTNEAHKII